MKGSTVESPTVVKEFLNILNDNLQSKTIQDFKEMQKMKDAELNVKQVRIYFTLYYIYNINIAIYLSS